ncbi:MAG: hypothetical protein P1V81_17275 [Planctomycetota bacterium]|nr:hypothetical protein [Planctomycetota bacterium]
MPLEAGQTLSIFELEAPVATSFVLRGTVPLPKGTWPTGDGTIPAAVVDYDGTVVPAQVETVSRYPVAADGADVVEILATVRRDPAVAPGTRVQYEVTYSPHSAPADPGAVDIAELHSGPTPIPSGLRGLLQTPGNLRFVSTDVFGNEYVEQPLSAGNLRRHRYGETMTQLRSYEVMQPAPAVGGATGTLPHLFGIHSYMAVQANEPVLLLDVRVSNGTDGLDLTTTDDDPLDLVYFEDFELEVPAGWVVLQDASDPFVGAPYSHAGKVRYPLVKPNGDGSMHVMPSQGQFHRRLAIAPAADMPKAQALLDQAGLAFNVEATDPDSGLPMLSWFNPGTGRYFPQTHRLPSLAHMGLDSLRADLTGEFNDMRSHLEAGTDTSGYPLNYGRMGWAHPLGIQYGGMTGGVGIHLWQGVRTAAAASVDGYRRLMDVHRAQTDRMPVAIYNKFGETTSINDWVMEGTDYTYVSFYYYNGKRNAGDDVFGYDLAPSFQVDHVVSQGLQPAYEADLLGFQAHDIQHLGRYTRAPKALAWLGNDALSKEDLQRQAQIFHLEYHEHYNSFWKHLQPTGLLQDKLDTAAAPGVGFDFGRGEGWGLDAVNAAYALSRDETWRAEVRDWLAQVTEAVNMGQADCSGIIQSVYSSKWLGGNYRIRQSIEGAIIENALRGMRERVFEGVSAPHTAMLNDVLHDSYNGMMSGLAWNPSEVGPYSHLAVAPAGAQLTPFCLPGDLPGDGTTGYTDNFQVWSSLAYAYEMTGNPLFIQGLQRLTSNSDVTAALEAGGTENIFNRAAAIAMAQEL